MSTRELGYKRVLGVQNDDTITYTVQEDQREAHLRNVSIILIVYSLQNNRINFFPNEVGLNQNLKGRRSCLRRLDWK